VRWKADMIQLNLPHGKSTTCAILLCLANFSGFDPLFRPAGGAESVWENLTPKQNSNENRRNRLAETSAETYDFFRATTVLIVVGKESVSIQLAQC